VPAALDKLQRQHPLHHVARLPHASIIEADKIASLAGEIRQQDFLAIQQTRNVIDQFIESFLHCCALQFNGLTAQGRKAQFSMSNVQFSLNVQMFNIAARTSRRFGTVAIGVFVYWILIEN
jgi:hypothetical protein